MRNQIVLGSDPLRADFVVEHRAVSGAHAKVFLDGHRQLWIEDLDSTNGTWIDGEQLPTSQPARLRIGQTVGLGKHAVFVIDDAIVGQWFEAALPGGAVPAPREVRRAEPQSTSESAWVIGRDRSCDIVLDVPNVSSRHAKMTSLGQGRFRLEDLGSTNGLRAHRHDNRVSDVILGLDDTVYFGSYAQRVRGLVHRSRHVRSFSAPMNEGAWLVVGRDPEEGGLKLEHPVVSRAHARVRWANGALEVEDLGSANGTFVNGVRTRGVVRVGTEDVISLGSYPVRFDRDAARGGRLSARVDGGVSIVAEGLSVDVPRRDGGGMLRILSDVSFTVYGGELVALMGPSGAGKTTLLRAMNGYQAPSAGSTTIGGADVNAQFESLRGAIGYVPQDDIVFPQLTVAESLRYTARLRLPRDTSDAEIEARIDQILRDLQIEQTRDRVIGDALNKGISGGQRKRVNLAQELITDPPILFLDEPTSGLSAGDTLVVMRLLRSLADEGRTIVVTIHQPSLKAYRLFDHVAYLFFGRLAYFGPAFPDSITYFQRSLSEEAVEQPSEAALTLYDPGSALEPMDADIVAAEQADDRDAARDQAACRWDQRFRSSAAYREFVHDRRQASATPAAPTRQSAESPSFIRQVNVLTSRMLRLKLRDRGALFTTFFFAPLFAGLTAFANRPQAGDRYFFEIMVDVPNALVLLVVVSFMFASFGAASDIVSEAAVLKREQMANLRASAYVSAKAVVHGMMVAGQSLLLTLVGNSVLPLETSPLGLFTVLWLVSMCGAGIGLIASASARTSLQAILIVVAALALQLIIGGTTVPLPNLPSSLQTVSAATVVRWGSEAAITSEFRALDVEQVLSACASKDAQRWPESEPYACEWQALEQGGHYRLVDQSRAVDDPARWVVAPRNAAEVCLSICRRLQLQRSITPIDLRFGTDEEDPERAALLDRANRRYLPQHARGDEERAETSLRAARTPRVALAMDLALLALMSLASFVASGLIVARRNR